MTKAESDAPRQRQQHLAQLEEFRKALLRVVRQSGETAPKLRQAVEQSLSGECNQCGIRVTGAELLAEPSLDGDPVEQGKIQRLRRGDCARSGCDSFYYKLVFGEHPDINWTQLLDRAETAEEELPEASAEQTSEATVSPWQLRKPIVIRVCLALAILILLFVIRQWYRGGTIPLIRQPEHFQVDRMPNEQAEAERAR